MAGPAESLLPKRKQGKRSTDLFMEKGLKPGNEWGKGPFRIPMCKGESPSVKSGEGPPPHSDYSTITQAICFYFGRVLFMQERGVSGSARAKPSNQ